MSTGGATVLRVDPDFIGGTRVLLEALRIHANIDARVAILNGVAKRLGDENYPAFIKIVCVIGESADTYAKQLLAESLAHAMRKGELPSGSLTSWGVSTNWIAAASGVPGSFFRSAPRRNLGPIEYLSSWHSQPTNRPGLTDDVYRMALASLLHLFNASPSAARAYQTKLAADSLNELEGTFTAMTRARLAAIAALWDEGCAPEEIARRIVWSG